VFVIGYYLSAHTAERLLTEGFIENSAERMIDTPISKSGDRRRGLRRLLMGMKPTPNFSLLILFCFDMLIELRGEIALSRLVNSGGLRGPAAAVRGGPFHLNATSLSLNTAGLKMVEPSTAQMPKV